MDNSIEWKNLSQQNKNTILELQEEMPVKLGMLAKEFGIIVKKATLPANISGEIKESSGVVTIKVNRHDVKARQRFTLAHEIAHFLLHRHLLKDGIQDDVLYRSSQSSKVEAEANRLAADIVMPLNKTNELMLKYAKDCQGDGVYELVAQDFDVSPTALKIRLGKI